MVKKNLCTNCKTGKNSYLLDQNEPMCPYINCLKGKKCPFYLPLPKEKKEKKVNNKIPKEL